MRLKSGDELRAERIKQAAEEAKKLEAVFRPEVSFMLAGKTLKLRAPVVRWYIKALEAFSGTADAPGVIRTLVEAARQVKDQQTTAGLSADALTVAGTGLLQWAATVLADMLVSDNDRSALPAEPERMKEWLLDNLTMRSLAGIIYMVVPLLDIEMVTGFFVAAAEKVRTKMGQS